MIEGHRYTKVSKYKVIEGGGEGPAFYFGSKERTEVEPHEPKN